MDKHSTTTENLLDEDYECCTNSGCTTFQLEITEKIKFLEVILKN